MLRPDDDDEPPAEYAGGAPPESQAPAADDGPAPQAAARWRPVSAEEKQRILADAVVAETMQLFDGILVNALVRSDDTPAEAPEAVAPAEDETE